MGFASPQDGSRALDLSAHESSGLSVTGVAETYPADHVVPSHQHGRAHLLYAAEGVMRVQASTGQWLVPPTAAVWLRPNVEHRLVMHTPVRVYGIFVDVEAAGGLPSMDGVLHVSALLKALIAELARPIAVRSDSRREALLTSLFLEELGSQRPLPFHLPWPVDGPVQQVCEALVRDPAHLFSADDWAASLAMSSKTFQRRFRNGTGMTFGRWRQQLRLMSSVTTLLGGAPITQVALNSGYESHSAYAVAFKKHFGVPPSKFLSTACRPAG
jgi:AraC-like DNA-binding protein/quercetin dioxygenase-like cupin family protein